MNQEKIISIIDALANGIDPITGEVLPDNSPYNHPEVIRALFHTIKLLPKAKKPKKQLSKSSKKISKKGNLKTTVYLGLMMMMSYQL